MAKVGAKGVRFELEGFEELLRGLKNADRHIAGALRDALKGPWGREVVAELKLRLLGTSKRTGYTASTIGIHEDAMSGEVEVGAHSEVREKKHPSSERANVRSILTWIESGVAPHTIRVRGRRVLAFGGRVVKHVEHPGFRARRPMRKTLRATQAEGEDMVLEYLVERIDRELRRAGVKRSRGGA